MNLRKFLQCPECEKDLEDFMAGEDLTTKEKDLLVAYTVFTEMRRLKKQQAQKVEIPKLTSPGEPSSPWTTIPTPPANPWTVGQPISPTLTC